MRLALPFGPASLDVELPDDAAVLAPKPASPLSQPTQDVRLAIAAPAATPPFAELARGRRTCCIAVPDLTRPAVWEWVIPPLRHALREAGVEHLEIVIATGTHRAATADEIVRIVGAEAAREIPVRSHDTASGEHVHVGRTDAGIEVWIDAGYVRSDLRVALGLVEPHLVAGYSGGGKTICPGLARLDTVRGVHRASLARERVGPGIVEGNPFRAEVRQAARLAGVDFALQCVATPDGKLAFVAAGDLDAAVERATAFVEPHARLRAEAPFDVVVTTAGGFNLDRTLYQAAKGWIAALGAVRPGGDVLLVAEMREGIGSRDFESLLSEVNDGSELDRRLDSPEFFRRDQWMVQHVFQARARARLHAVTRLPRERLEALGFTTHASVEEALARLLPPAGPHRLLVLPRGPFGIVTVGEQLVTLEGAVA
jgi:nickel-dependent lactate racemase